jgi:hypothetical protein
MSTPQIFVGKWTDWSHGAILGASLTVQEKYGRYIIAAMASFVGIVASYTWTIVAYVVHRTRVPRHSADPLLRQQQVSLINSQSPLSTSLELLCLAWTWSPRWGFCFRRRRQKRFSHGRNCSSLGLLLIPLLLWIVFIALGILSALVAKRPNEGSSVRIKAGNCGLWIYDTTHQSQYDRKVLNDTLAARAYARSCYSKDLDLLSPVSCSFYTVSRLNYTSRRLLQQCPFGLRQTSANLNDTFNQSLCNVTLNTGAHYMETADLDSHEDLGINSVPSDRLQFQKMVTCSPIAWQGHTRVNYGPLCNPNPDSNNCTAYQEYDFGPISTVSTYTYLYDPGTIRQGVGYAIK